MSYLKEHDDHVKNSGHIIYDHVNISAYYGDIQVLMCNVCGYYIVICEHSYNTWNDEGTILSCRLCGTDGT